MSDSTPRSRQWTDHDLERFGDSDLPEKEARLLREDLLADAGLRTRLDRIRSIDDLARRAMTRPSESHAPAGSGGREGRRLRAGALLAAACLALLVGAGVWFAAWRAPGAGPDAGSPGPSGVAPAPKEGTRAAGRQEDHERAARRPAARVVFTTSIPARRVWRAMSEANNEGSDAPPSWQGVDRALDAGDALGAARRITALSGADRSRAFRALGARLRSADAASEALTALPPASQIEAIRVWSEQTSLRPVAFARLRELLASPATRAEAEELRESLRQNPALRPWLASYAAAHAPPSGS